MSHPTGSPVWELFTPEDAAEALGHIHSQRNLRRSTVAYYAADMLAGRWSEDVTPIVFDEHGNLVNGRHRLSAVELSGVTVGFWVRRGVPADAILRMDQGAPRTAGDQLAIHGQANVNVTAAAARAVLSYEKHRDIVWNTLATAGVSKSAIVDEVLQNADDYVLGNAAAERLRKGGVLRSAGICLAVIVERYSSHSEQWEEFESGIMTGANLGPTDPRLQLRNYWNRDGRPRSWGGIQSHVIAMTTGWNKYIQGVPTGRVQHPQRRHLPMPEVV